MPTLTWSPPAVTPGNVVYGTAAVFVNPTVSASLPADASLGVSSAWTSASWTFVGATDQGVSLNFNPSTVDIRIEEQPTPVATTIDSAQMTVSFDISEETLNGIKLAYAGNGSIATTAAGAGQPGKQVLTLSTIAQNMSAAVLVQNQLGYARVLSIPSVMSAGTVGTSFRRSASQRLWPVTLNATCAFSSIAWIDLTAPATS
jgi:hypothetical protein